MSEDNGNVVAPNDAAPHAQSEIARHPFQFMMPWVVAVATVLLVLAYALWPQYSDGWYEPLIVGDVVFRRADAVLILTVVVLTAVLVSGFAGALLPRLPKRFHGVQTLEGKGAHALFIAVGIDVVFALVSLIPLAVALAEWQYTVLEPASPAGCHVVVSTWGFPKSYNSVYIQPAGRLTIDMKDVQQWRAPTPDSPLRSDYTLTWDGETAHLSSTAAGQDHYIGDTQDLRKPVTFQCPAT